MRGLGRLPGTAAILALFGCLTAGVAACSPNPSTHSANLGRPAAAPLAQAGQRATGPADGASPAGSPGALPLAGEVIAIDPGHNGRNWAFPAIINRPVNVLTEWKACDTTGTQTDAGYTEHAFTFNVAKRLARLLRARGARVVLTRTNDHGVGPCITRRAAIGNRSGANAAISIHADGGPPGGYGFDVIEPGAIPGHPSDIVAPSRRLAVAIRDAYQRITGEPYATYVGQHALDVRTDLGGLNLSTVPKVFIECGNMRNAQDAAKLSDPAFRQRIAVALADGLGAFLREQPR